jgi:hypothetical protein
MLILPTFALLVVAHMLADFPLQGQFLSEAKNRFFPVPTVPWVWPMAAHSIIHGGAVWMVTGIWWLGALEAGCHFVIDDNKCARRITFTQDQLFHISLKALWAAIAWAVTRG